MADHDTTPAFPFGDAPGMTLRDYFAAAAMQGMLASGNTIEILRNVKEGVIHVRGAEAASIIAYEYADAMLEQREKT